MLVLAKRDWDLDLHLRVSSFGVAMYLLPSGVLEEGGRIFLGNSPGSSHRIGETLPLQRGDLACCGREDGVRGGDVGLLLWSAVKGEG